MSMIFSLQGSCLVTQVVPEAPASFAWRALRGRSLEDKGVPRLSLGTRKLFLAVALKSAFLCKISSSAFFLVSWLPNSFFFHHRASTKVKRSCDFGKSMRMR